MGIRPSMNLIMGIPKVKEEDIPEFNRDDKVILKNVVRYQSGLSEEENKKALDSDNIDSMFVNSLVCTRESENQLFGTIPKHLGECLIDLEMEDGHIFGYKVKREYNNDFTWALKAIYPKYNQNSYDILPPASFEEYYALGRMLKNTIDTLKSAEITVPLSKLRSGYKKHPEIKKYRRWAKNGWLVQNGEYDTTLVAWAKAAMMLFDQIGFEYKPNQIRVIFAIEWS